MARRTIFSVRKLMRRWDAIRAGWPALLIPFIGSLFIVSTGQGQEALYAMTQLSRSLPAVAALILCGIVIHARFVAAVNVHYPFSGDAVYSQDALPWAAFFAGAAMPLVFGAWFAVRTSEGVSPPIGLGLCLAAAIVLVCWHLVARRRLLRVVQTHTSRFLVFGLVWRITEAVLLAALLAAALALWVAPQIASAAGPVAVFAVGMTVWAAVANFALARLARMEWMPSPLLTAVAFLVVVGICSALLREVHYPVATIGCSGEPACSASALPDAVTYAREWLLAHGASKRQPIEAIVVTSNGGGIRAALQTATVLSELDEMSAGQFFNDTYALSGVSGGAVGLATYIAERGYLARTRNPSHEVEDVEEDLKSDHFSPMLAGLILRDIPDLFLPFSILRGSRTGLLPDRAALFEESLGTGWPGGNEMNVGLIRAVRDTAPGRVGPVVLFNTTSANSGTVETASNVFFPERSGAPKLCNVLERLGSDRTLTLATAAHVAGRFPLFDAPGELKIPTDANGVKGCWLRPGTLMDYVDGGYLDNTGARAALAAVQALEIAVSDLRKGSYPLLKVHLVVIHIYASSGNAYDPKSIEAAGDGARTLDDIEVPIQAVGAVRSELGLAPLRDLCLELAKDDDFDGTSLCGSIGTKQSRSNEKDFSVVTVFAKRGLPWINAALYESDDSAQASYVPLGWMLGPSACYVQRQSETLARTIGNWLGFGRNVPDRPCRREED